MRVILATRNRSKITQIRPFFKNAELFSLTDAGIEGSADETGTTLFENAKKKALFAHERAKHLLCWCIADDSGLFIDALGGEPGVDTAYWAGRSAKTPDITQYALTRINEIADVRPHATWRTVAAVVSPLGELRFFQGEVSGHLLKALRGESQPDMPYSALFVPDGQEKTWAEMTTEEENAISHRGKAFAQVREFLRTAS